MLRPCLEDLLGRWVPIRPGETAAVVTDAPQIETGRALMVSLEARGVRPALICPGRLPQSASPDPVLLSALRDFQHVILATSRSPIHSPEVLGALWDTPAQVYDLSGNSAEALQRLLDVDRDASDQALDRLWQALSSGGTFHITSPGGTDLRFRIGPTPERPASAIPGRLHLLPPGLLWLLPEKGSMRGRVVLDGIVAGFGRPNEPVTLFLQDDEPTGISDPGLEEFLQRNAPLPRPASVVMLGLNPNARTSGSIAEEILVPRRITIGLGCNLAFGGGVAAPCLIEACLESARISVDGRPLPDDAWPAPAPRPTAEPPLKLSPALYEELFHESIEPQYILDFHTQVFLDVNEAFARLLGMSREEIIGRIKPSEIVAPAGRELLARRRAARLQRPVDRYELQFLSRSGRVRPVEVTVRVIEVQGRPVLIGTVHDLTRRRAAEEVLRESEKRYSNLFHYSNDAILLHDPEGRILDANPRAADLFGFRKTELLSMRMPDLYADGSPTSTAAFRKDPRKSFVKFETRFRKRTGEVFPAEVSSSTFELEGRRVIQEAIRDITVRKRAEEALAQSEARLRMVMGSAPVILFAVDAEGKLTLLEGRGVAALGIDPEGMIGRPIFELFREIPDLEARYRRSLQGETVTSRVEIGGKILETRHSPLRDDAGNIIGVIGVATDVTRQQELQEKASRKMLEVLNANRRIGILREKLERVQEFARHLLNLRDESRMLEDAERFMCERSKLGWSGVAFYMKEGNRLRLARGSGDAPLEIPADEGPAARLLAGTEEVSIEGDRLFAPLQGIEQDLGILMVRVPPKEMETLRESPAAARSYQNIVRTLGHLLGLSIENLRLYNRVFKQSILDPLTQTYNRRYLDTKLEEETRRARRYGRPLSILMIDVNGFKAINDNHPMRHQQGDVVLREIAAVLKGSTREVDVVARYGGDEFLVVLPETPEGSARRKAESLARLVSETAYTDLRTGKKELHLTISVGVASVGEIEGAVTPEGLVRAADREMYADKRRQRAAR